MEQANRLFKMGYDSRWQNKGSTLRIVGRCFELTKQLVLCRKTYALVQPKYNFWWTKQVVL